MVADLRRKIAPGVDVDVFVIHRLLCRQRRTDEHMIELLRITIKQIRISFERIDLRNFIQILEARNGCVLLKRCDKGKFVEIAGGYNVRRRRSG